MGIGISMFYTNVVFQLDIITAVGLMAVCKIEILHSIIMYDFHK